MLQRQSCADSHHHPGCPCVKVAEACSCVLPGRDLYPPRSSRGGAALPPTPVQVRPLNCEPLRRRRKRCSRLWHGGTGLGVSGGGGAGPQSRGALPAVGAMGASSARAALCVAVLWALGLGQGAPGGPSCGPGRLLRGTGTDARCCGSCSSGKAPRGARLRARLRPGWGQGPGVREPSPGRGWGPREEDGCPDSPCVGSEPLAISQATSCPVWGRSRSFCL